MPIDAEPDEPCKCVYCVMDRNRLQRELSEAKAEVSACLRFLSAELGWESFRAEMLYHSDEQKKSTSESNAQKLQNYLADSGHGVAFLREAERLREDRDMLRDALEEWYSAFDPRI